MNTTTIRPTIFARSCNDDYCPAMEDLCVKMSLLSLQSDSKMEAYDAKLEQFFYEEKDEIEDLSRDEQNEDTFVDNDETEYSIEVCAFNTRYGTCFTAKKLAIFLDYIAEKGLEIEDGIDYIQHCHTCGDQLEEFGSEYCNNHCRDEFGERPGRECFHGYDCLICHGYPKSTCYWAHNGCDKCDAYDGPEEERYPYSCTNCLTQMTDHEGYNIEYHLYCNNCAVDLFDKTEHLEDQDQDDDSNDSKKRRRESDDEDEDNESESKRQRLNEKLQKQMSALTDESCDIWELALDINHGDKKAALLMIEDQPRLRAHPRIIEYYRAKEASSEDMDFEECSSECSSEDDNLQQRKRARHIRFESVDLDVSDAEDEADTEDEADAKDAMVIDLLSQEDNDEDDYDYAESVVDDDGEVDYDDWNEMAVSNSVTMPQTSMVQMVTMIQDLRDENAALRHELELVRSQRRMLFPEGSSMSITYEDGERYINVHAQAPTRGLTMDDLECGYGGASGGGGGSMEIDEEPLRLTRLTADSLPNMHNNMYGSYDDLQGSDIYPGGCSYNNRTTRR